MEEQRMTGRIPESHLDLFRKQTLGHLATLMPDGHPHVTPVWVDYDGIYILVNTVIGRQKEQNARQRPWVAMDITDSDNISRRLIIRGSIAEITTEGADAHMNKLVRRYMGLDTNPYDTPGETRVILKIKPEYVAFK